MEEKNKDYIREYLSAFATHREQFSAIGDRQLKEALIEALETEINSMRRSIVKERPQRYWAYAIHDMGLKLIALADVCALPDDAIKIRDFRDYLKDEETDD